MGRWSRIWNEYWFTPAPLADLAVFRIIATAGQLFLYLFLWRPLSGDFLAVSEIPHLYEPLAAVRVLLRPVGTDWVPTLSFVSVAFFVTVGALALSLLGLWTNVSLAAAAVGSVFVQAYAYSFGDVHHPEAIMAIALAILAISPCGRVLSVDNYRRRRRGTSLPIDATSPFARWPARLLICFLGLIYLSAAYYKFKAGGHGWLNGYTLQFYLLQDGLRWHKPLGVWLAGQHGIALVASAVTVLFEALFILVVFIPRLLWLMWPIGFGMHLGILLLMSAGFWEYLILYLAILPWSALVGAYRRRAFAKN
jgi:hypothetical protein